MCIISAMSFFLSNKTETSVSVYDAELYDGITVYKIKVRIGAIEWIVSHRYKDFDDLHYRLVADHGVSKDLLPPKKVLRNKCPKFVEQRREKLDEYVKNVFGYLQITMPRVFAVFLDFHLYDIFFLLQDLAKKLFDDGDILLQKAVYYKMKPLELYAISERLKMPCPNMELVDKVYDFSHVIDFCSQLSSLQIEGSNDPVLMSNIIPNNLKFDLSCFKSLKKLMMVGIPLENVQNTGTLRTTVSHLRVHMNNCTSIGDILLCDVVHKEECENMKDVAWTTLVEANFSSNHIADVDKTIKLAPDLKTLHLNKNKLSTIANLSSLSKLAHLSLVQNSFTACEDWHFKIGQIVSINLSQNKITSLRGFARLFSLESLDLSCNLIADVEEVQHICKLPNLENLMLTANPVASIVDYRIKVIEQFNMRMGDICLDNEKPAQKELDTARVLQALRIVKEGRTPTFLNSGSPFRSNSTTQN